VAVTIDLLDRYEQGYPIYPKIGYAVHHSVTTPPDCDESEEILHLDAIAAYHRRQFRVDFGYHVAVFPCGHSYRCGALGTQRAHVAGLNHMWDGLVFIGTGRPTDAALLEASSIVQGQRIVGHKDLPNQQTACPGDWDVSVVGEQMLSRPLSVADLGSLYRVIAPGLPAVIRPAGVAVKSLPMRGSTRVYEVELPS